MIWALLAAYFLSGGLGGTSGSMLTSAAVKLAGEQAGTIIVDPDRADAAKQIFSELRKEAKGFEKSFSRAGKQLTKTYSDHAAHADQALALIQDLNSDWEAAQQRALDLRFELKDQMTEGEWAELIAPEQVDSE